MKQLWKNYEKTHKLSKNQKKTPKIFFWQVAAAVTNETAMAHLAVAEVNAGYINSNVGINAKIHSLSQLNVPELSSGSATLEAFTTFFSK